MTDTTAPRTAAGRALLDRMWYWRTSAHNVNDEVTAVVLNIEAEAIEPLLALVRAAQDTAETIYTVRVGLDAPSSEGAVVVRAQTVLRVIGNELAAALAALDPAIVVAARKP